MKTYEKLLHIYVETHNYSDFLAIFEHYKVDFEKVCFDLKNLGFIVRWNAAPGPRACLSNFKDILDMYMDGKSIRKIIDYYYDELGIKLPKTCLQGMVSDIGYLRSRSEATKLAIKNGYVPYSSDKFPIEAPYYGNKYYYNLGNRIVTLKSSYELAFLQQLISKGISDILYESERIQYIDPDGLERIYIPDFKYTLNGVTHICEVKPNVFQEDEYILAKKSAAEIYCNERSWIYELVGESKINFDKFPNYSDKNIVFSRPHYTHDDLVKFRIEEGAINPNFDEHFITKVYEGTYTYKDHPRTNPLITYKSIMDYVNSFPKYECTKTDVYNFCTRNQLARRLRDEAQGKDKDIQYWQSHYLAIPERTSSAQKRAMLEVQLDGLRDFGLLTLDQIRIELKKLNRKIATPDIYNLTGWGQNKSRIYFWEVLNSDIYEIIEEINNAFIATNSSL